MSRTDDLRRLLDERGVEHYDGWSGEIRYTKWQGNYGMWFLTHDSFGTDGKLLYVQGIDMTPEQAIEATLGREPWVNPTWERWHKSLKHDEIKSIGDAVEQLMYEAIEFGGDMGQNGNVCEGIDEGDVLTAGFINGWVERFESTLGRDLQAENAKLRELVRDALTTISWCTIDCYPSDNKKCELNERARELGVEV